MPIEEAVLRRTRKREVRGRSPSSCKPCRRKGTPCDGQTPSCRYGTGTRHTYHQSLNSPGPSSSSRSSSLALRSQFVSITSGPSFSSQLFNTDQEHRSFTFFCQHTVPQVSTTFSDEFWRRLVLQATHHEPAVRHAAIALGSLHEKFMLHDSTMLRKGGTSEEETFALSQYVKALGSLLEPAKADKKQAADVALMTCILFVSFETLRGHHSAALKHVDAGIKIISELSSTQSSSSLSISPNPYTPLSTLNRLFIRLETQAGTITFGRKRQLVSSPHDFGSDGYGAEMPCTFTSIEQARNALEYIRVVGSQAPRIYFRLGEGEFWSSADVDADPEKENIHTVAAPFSTQPFITKPPPPSPLEVAKTEVTIELIRSSAALRLRQWSAAFESFLASHPSPDSEPLNKATIALIKLHKIIMEVSFKIDYWRALNDEMVWDEHLPDFKAVVDLAEEFIICSTPAPPHSHSHSHIQGQVESRQVIFNLDIGLIVPLYFVIGKCRDHAMRTKAIQLLRSSERQEGVSNSLMAAQIAERLVELEEGGMGGEGRMFLVPRERRISGVEIRFEIDGEGGEGGRGAWVRFQIPKTSNKEGKGKAVEEWIEW
ncbi:hypothetical protein N431DRAFT_493541 [Stipitochalara longipes BDJ]|nr:hypothetical protein N431DRAFT_493541 [Stipitochalara longipes BDJ]